MCVLPVLTKGMYMQHEDWSSGCIFFRKNTSLKYSV